jgi:formamidopyrimidine-DNA glycosylase
MPELPEVETTRRGLQPHLEQRRITRIDIRQPQLRWPVPETLSAQCGQRIERLQRRGKYLILRFEGDHYWLWHLGMSGSLRLLPADAPAGRHEHVQIDLDGGQSLRYRDPRRFGALLGGEGDPLRHPLLASLGPEPLGEGFDAAWLYRQCQRRSAAIKQVIMDSHVVVGVGNIYACESLFRAAIHPKTPARRIRLPRIGRLVDSIRTTLAEAIEQGGTTLRDFTRSDGQPGYFAQRLAVYGQQGDCPRCGRPIRRIVQAQRSTFYCPGCQH